MKDIGRRIEEYRKESEMLFPRPVDKVKKLKTSGYVYVPERNSYKNYTTGDEISAKRIYFDKED